ncbi:LytR C-terminal domain-containing protein [Arcanobacterium haemolyticum]|nr:LytR C-terminal domain-containing protein [Arcanobacterium haemolyticum]
MAENKYPEDEFDLLAKERTVRGTHRRAKSNAKWWIALVAIIVVAPTLGWAYIHFLGVPTFDNSAKPVASASAEATTSESASAEPTVEPSESPTAEPTVEPEPTVEATPAPAADHTKSVLVLNASGVTGLAATQQAVLEKAGFTNVTIGNYQYSRPAASQIYYPAEADEATVAEIAQTLGISANNFVLNANATGGDQIVVVLAGDL